MKRRRMPRFSAGFWVNEYVEGTPHLARVLDLSSQGMMLRPVRPSQLTPEWVGLQFQIPGSEEVIYAEGRVVRDAGASTRSVEFTLLAPRHRNLLERWEAQRGDGAPLEQAASHQRS